ncbi:MAG: tyrosine-type recombinase/integrase [Clostridiales bacterium]|nr:tyrosine-type recombinase/integrase [Clostridiales bacterium]
MGKRSYHEQMDINNICKLRELIQGLPPFVTDFFRGIEPTTASRTRIAYAYDLQVFFHYLQENHPAFLNLSFSDITVTMLDQIKAIDLEKYMEYLRYYRTGSSGASDDTENLSMDRMNTELGIKRKISSLKSFYHYYFCKELIQTNPAALITLPKLHEKEIVRLDVDEIALLLDEVESGDKLTDRQKYYHEKTKVRDLAILTLMLGTGIRVSECVGLDMDDVDFKNSGIHIQRKGGKNVIVYFGDEVEEALLFYAEERKKIIPADNNENAFFLSLQKKRISVRSVENMVKKYARTVTSLKRITPHKLRSTYGTSLYRETGDIYLVADVLGHSDVNTTRRHYAALEEDRRRNARNKVQLREKP